MAKAGKMSIAHAAGIFADMSVDGPQIGTLVAIIDRARNLPNRKTMGKQNPYCAARLGKEAKKTETDMRGGQTPKWDQEIRFTVHESPDYYQLKVSVFNDDKKTDLIGETWIDLKNVIQPGGGQNDVWHGLQYKGKYAGDIRIELTYYDTRPEDEAVRQRKRNVEKVEAKAKAAAAVGSAPTLPNGLSGPREPKPIKRRPLPADPTGATPPPPEPAQSAPPPEVHHPAPARPQLLDQAQSSPAAPVTRGYDTPDDFQRHHITPPGSRHHASTSTPTHRLPRDTRSHSHEASANGYAMPNGSPVSAPRGHSYPPADQEPYQPVDYGHYHELPAEGPDCMADSLVQYSHDPYATPPRQVGQHQATPEHWDHGQSPVQRQRSNGSPYSAHDMYAPSPPEPLQQHSAPGPGDWQGHSHSQHRSPRASPTKNRNESYRDSPLRNSVSHSSFRGAYESMQPHVEDDPEFEDEGPPPPPPAHRAPYSQPQLPQRQPSYHDMQAVQVPEPLSMVPVRRNSGQPPSRPGSGYIAYSQPYVEPAPPSDRDAYSVVSAPSRASYGQYPRDYADPYVPEPHENVDVPPSLVAGYDPAIADAESERAMYEERSMRRRSYVTMPSVLPPEPVQPRAPSTYQTPVRSPVAVDENLASRSSVIVKPRASSPIPPRKSVSPRPMSSHSGISSTPFSPDSYDALNPKAGSSVAVRVPAPRYETPEEAMEAARQREVQKLRDVGPIIGNDGRVIDPSDHLPTDTWAPEPEKKQPKKPEVVVRFKHIPPRSQPANPQSLDPVSPVSPGGQSKTGRNRLQKQVGRPQSMVYVAPLRERENYGDYRSNPNTPPSTYTMQPRYRASPNSASGSPSGHYHSASVGPPIPAKIPIQPSYPVRGGDSRDALSEEMSRIDIGSVGDGRGSRRFRGSYGR